MGENKKGFRATWFLDEQFGFLNEEGKEDHVQGNTNEFAPDVNTVGGPASVTDELSCTSEAVNGTARSSVASSNASSQQSDISETMKLRSSSVSDSSRESTTSNVSGCDKVCNIERKEQCSEDENPTTRKESDEMSHNEKEIQENISTDFGDKTAKRNSRVDLSSQEISNSDMFSVSKDKLETNKQINTEVVSNVNTQEIKPNENNKDSVAERGQLKIASCDDEISIGKFCTRNSLVPGGGRVSVFIKDEFSFLNDETDDESGEENEGSNNDNKTSDTPDDQSKTDEVVNSNSGSCSTQLNIQSQGDITKSTNANEESSTPLLNSQPEKSLETNHKGSEFKTNDESESSKARDSKNCDSVNTIDNRHNVPMRNSKDKPGTERQADTRFFNDQFGFLDEEGLVENNDHEPYDKNSEPMNQLTTVKGLTSDIENTVLSNVRDNDMSSSSLSDKPRSPLLDRVLKSEASASGSKNHSSTSSSMSSIDSDPDTSEIQADLTDNPVFEADTNENGSQALPKITSERGPSTPNITRSVSISTTASELEFTNNYQEKVVHIVRPTLRHKKLSTSSYKRFTRQIPVEEKTIELERNDVNKSYGFHILKNDETFGYNPVVVSTVELGSLAHIKGIEVGDSIITVNDEGVLSCTEKEMQERIMKNPYKVKLGLGPNPIQPPMKSGYLSKQSSGLIKTYKKRWFELKEDNCLYYYKTEDSLSPLGVICLSNYTVQKATELDSVCFRLMKFDNRTYLLRGQSVEDMVSWADAIRQAAEAKILYPSKTSHHVNLPALQIKDPECYGLLDKRGNTSKMYHKRYCVLKDACLYYYTDQKSPTAKGVAHLHGYKHVSEFMHGKKFGFTMSPPSMDMKTYQFLADSEAERKRWISAMKTIEKWKEADDPL